MSRLDRTKLPQVNKEQVAAAEGVTHQVSVIPPPRLLNSDRGDLWFDPPCYGSATGYRPRLRGLESRLGWRGYRQALPNGVQSVGPTLTISCPQQRPFQMGVMTRSKGRFKPGAPAAENNLMRFALDSDKLYP